MQKTIVLDRASLLGFKLQQKDRTAARVVTGAKVGKIAPPPPAPVRG